MIEDIKNVLRWTIITIIAVVIAFVGVGDWVAYMLTKKHSRLDKK